MDFKITQEEILNGDISKLKTALDNIAPDSRLSAENENNFFIKFDKLSSYDFSQKLQESAYKAWFKKLDSEYPYIPFFLNKQSKTLMFFVMGNIDFSIDSNNNIHFDETAKLQYVSAKKSAIKAFCFTHNIDPKPAMRNMISFDQSQQKQANLKIIKIQDYLNKYRAITTFNEQRELVTWLLADNVPSTIKILLCSCIQNCPQPFFSIIIEYGETVIEYSSKIIPSKKDIEEFCQTKSSIKITFVFKDGDSHQSWNLEQPFTCMELEELEKKRNEILDLRKQPEEEIPSTESDEEISDRSKTDEVKDDDKTLVPYVQPEEENETTEETAATEDKNDEEADETVPQNETLEEKIARLEKENLCLKEKIRQKNNLIEDLERALNAKQRSKIVTFLKGLFK
jgi:hypothetical protein